MINILLEGCDIHAPWLFDALKRYLKPSHRVCVIALSFRDAAVKGLDDWNALYARERGCYYTGIWLSAFLSFRFVGAALIRRKRMSRPVCVVGAALTRRVSRPVCEANNRPEGDAAGYRNQKRFKISSLVCFRSQVGFASGKLHSFRMPGGSSLRVRAAPTGVRTRIAGTP